MTDAIGTRRSVLCAALVVLLSGCASDPGATPAASQTLDAAASTQPAKRSPRADSAAKGIGDAESSGPEAAAPGSTEEASAPEGAPDEAAAGTGGSKRFPPVNLPGKATVPVSASVSPQCVGTGDVVTLHVETKPEAAIGYQALYSDGQSGAGAPFGAGYGGNDKGWADKSGRFSSSWTVAPNAPSGRGKVDVVIGYEGEWGYDGPHFAVADSNGDCPSEWLDEEGRE